MSFNEISQLPLLEYHQPEIDLESEQPGKFQYSPILSPLKRSLERKTDLQPTTEARTYYRQEE
jgi:hypothetical protein